MNNKFKFNRLIYGAPGTGKSYKLDKDKEELLNKNTISIAENFERVTFYPDYSYGQFIGIYKPKMGEKGKVEYEFVLGPFLRLLFEALKKPEEYFLIIIEEINRANAAAVFGDIFQLLDREGNGKSKYLISISEDIKIYLKSKEDDLYKIFEKDQKLYLPENFYIWATMNTSDQGVNVLDSAFKRRFDEYEFIGINDNEDEIKGIEIKINGVEETDWNEFRKKLNNFLSQIIKVKEDKLIGPFFIKPDILKNEEDFKEAFFNKLVMYLAEDVLSYRKTELFESTSLSELKNCYYNGENIFSEKFLKFQSTNKQ